MQKYLNTQHFMRFFLKKIFFVVMGIMDRLTQIINNKQVSERKFFSDAGLSISFGSRKKGGKRTISSVSMNKILEAYPDINPNWLISGEGEMFLQGYTQEVIPVPEEKYMMVEYQDLETSAGLLGQGDVNSLPEGKMRLLPREYETGNYLVVRVSGNSMDDNSKRSLCDGDEILIKQCFDSIAELPILHKLFVITTRNGSVVKQITKIDNEKEYIVCHSFNESVGDYRVNFQDILQVFTVEKIVNSKVKI